MLCVTWKVSLLDHCHLMMGARVFWVTMVMGLCGGAKQRVRREFRSLSKAQQEAFGHAV